MHEARRATRTSARPGATTGATELKATSGSPAVSGPLASASRALAFGFAAPAYAFLTAHDAWRASCRALGELVPGPRVLDLGVGPGASVLEVAVRDGRVHVGLDVSHRMLQRAAHRARARGLALPLVRADAMVLPFRDGALDGVTAHSVIYLLPDPAAALAEVSRVLRPGGRVALLEPRASRPSLRGAWSGGPRYLASMLLWRAMSRLHSRFDERSLVALVEAAGLVRARAWPVLAGFGVVTVAERAA